MRVSFPILATASFLTTANAALQGFNYGANFANGQAKREADFEYEFNAAKQLPGTNGWTSARLYTMVQYGTQNTVIEAVQAAINTKTQLLLGLWASAGPDNFNNEIIALKTAIALYGQPFADLVVGVSVGSEDLYRITATGIQNNAGPGAQPSELVNYINQVRTAVQGSVLEGKLIGHVDTWTAFVNATNNPVISALDFLGVDAYPYYQTTMLNDVGRGGQLFFDAYQATVNSAQGKPVWVTETGWPVSGRTLNQAVPSAANARIYWEDVGCQLLKNNVNLFYYTLQDVQWGNPDPSFGIKPGGDLNTVQPLFDLSCPGNLASSIATSSASRLRGSVSSANSQVATQVSAMKSTTRLAIIATPPVLNLPAPSRISGRYEAPHYIVPVDKSNPSNVIGNSFKAQVTSNIATMFIFDIKPTDAGKTCKIVLYIPPAVDIPKLSPVHINSPGSLAVSYAGNKISIPPTAKDVDGSKLLGSIQNVQYGQQYNIASSPCQAGQRVGYQISGYDEVNIEWFQMTSPPLGLFVLVQ